MMVHRSDFAGATQEQAQPRLRVEHSPWQKVPWYIPMRWLGYDMRRSTRRYVPTGQTYGMEYGKSSKIAREELRKQFALVVEEAPTQQRRSPNWIG